eukprot:3137160-Amphidinium_carterae.4
MKRPFDHPRDLPTHAVHHLPHLPRNLDWCFPELNVYAQTGLFPLHFHKKLIAYFDESIAYMCETNADHRTLQEQFAELDAKHGPPHSWNVLAQVHVDWCRWAHERSVNEGYSTDDSQRWLLERDMELKDVIKGMPPPTLRQSFASPHGLFPQNWPEPDAPDEMNTDTHLFAALVTLSLVMDDYDNRTAGDQVFPNNDFRSTLTPEGMVREAGLLMAVPDSQVQAAVVYAHERVSRQEEERAERYMIHHPSDIMNVSQILLQANASEADVMAAASMGVEVTHIHVSVDPNAHPPVSQVSAPALLEVPVPAEPSAAAPTTKAVPKSPPASLLAQPSPPLVEQTAEQKWYADIASRTEANEEAWLADQANICNSLLIATRPVGPPPDHAKPTLLGTSVYRNPELPEIPPNALAQEVDPSNFPTFTEWKRQMDAAP